ncbi:hypothetical protein Enr10x_42040 [Gimesia panareensis]|uniref:Uncharacterized protein n=1 Tax=Gimesia panareensis TaxID=2527978 RepID=A0A517QB52_9PLAN|nr:hypothetical protein Enr10x_42040 [Gimesia panareensis]
MNWQTLTTSTLEEILDWAATQPWCQAMSDCAQDAQWHATRVTTFIQDRFSPVFFDPLLPE